MSGPGKKKLKSALGQGVIELGSDEDKKLTELRTATRNMRTPSTDSLEIIAISKRKRVPSHQIQATSPKPSVISLDRRGVTVSSDSEQLPKKRKRVTDLIAVSDCPPKPRISLDEPTPENCQLRRFMHLFPLLSENVTLKELLVHICTEYDPSPEQATHLQRMISCCFESCALHDSLVAVCVFGRCFFQLGYSGSELKLVAGLEANKGHFGLVLTLIRKFEKNRIPLPAGIRSIILQGLAYLIGGTTVCYKTEHLKAVVKEVTRLASVRYNRYQPTNNSRSCSTQIPHTDVLLSERCVLELSQIAGFWQVLELQDHLSLSADAFSASSPSAQNDEENSALGPTSLLTYLQLGLLVHKKRPKLLLPFLSARVFPPALCPGFSCWEDRSPPKQNTDNKMEQIVSNSPTNLTSQETEEQTQIAAQILTQVFALTAQVGRKFAFGPVFADRPEQRVRVFLQGVRLSLEGDSLRRGIADVAGTFGRIVRRVCSPIEKPSDPAYLTYFSENAELVRMFFHEGFSDIVEKIFSHAQKIMHSEVKLFILAVCFGHDHMGHADPAQFRRIITLTEEKLNLGVKRGHQLAVPDGQSEYYERGLLELCKTYLERCLFAKDSRSSDLAKNELFSQDKEYKVQKNLKISKLPTMFDKYCHLMFGRSLNSVWIVEDESLHARFYGEGDETQTGMKYWVKKKNTTKFSQERPSNHSKFLISKPDFAVSMNSHTNWHLSDSFFLSTNDRVHTFNRDNQSLQSLRWQSKKSVGFMTLISDVQSLRIPVRPRVLHLYWLKGSPHTVLAVGYHRFPNQQNIPFSRPSAYRFFKLPSTKRFLDWQLPYNPNSELTFHSTNLGIVSCSLEPLGYLALEFLNKRKSLRFQAVDASNQLIHKVLLHGRYLVLLTSHDVKICEFSTACRVNSVRLVRTLIGSPFSEGAFLADSHLLLVSKYDPLKRLSAIDLQTWEQSGIWMEKTQNDLILSAAVSNENALRKEGFTFKQKVLDGCDPTQYKVTSELIISRDNTRFALIQCIPDEPYQASQKYSSVRICDLPTEYLAKLMRSNPQQREHCAIHSAN